MKDFTLRQRIYLLYIENYCKVYSLNENSKDDIKYLAMQLTTKKKSIYYLTKKFKQLIKIKNENRSS